MKRTKIVCTIGPASRDKAVFRTLVEAGLDVARLNFSHGTHEDHRKMYGTIREVSRELGREVAILQDLQGPKIRVGKLQGDGMELIAGTRVTIVVADEQPPLPGGALVIPTTYKMLPQDVTIGDAILMDDGLLRLEVTGIDRDRVACDVLVGGPLKNRKGINLPGAALSAPALTEKDRIDLAFGLKLGVDMVGLSFVRHASDIQEARDLMREAGRLVPIIAKIEKPQAVANIDAILDAAEGIMVARGDLGVEMGPEKVPLIQKHCIEAANLRGKLVITATQMLESMVDKSFPTRAEASDVANAVLDHSDAVMLSAETATGKHPRLAIETMANIIREIEASPRYRNSASLPPVILDRPANAVAHAAAAAASTLTSCKAVVCVSIHGFTPKLLSDYRPALPIIALTGDHEECQRLAAFWGVTPLRFDFIPAEPVEDTLIRAESHLYQAGLCEGDLVVITLAVPTGIGLHTNTLKVHRLGHRDSDKVTQAS